MISLTKKQIKTLVKGDGSKNRKEILKHLMSCGQPQIFDESNFCVYTSGEIGNYYIQTADTLKDGRIQVLVVIELCRMILKDYGSDTKSLVVSGGATRDWPYSYGVQLGLILPHLSIYDYSGDPKDAKTIGFDAISNRQVIHVADLNNEGSSVRDKWLPKIKQLGGHINNVYFVAERNEDGREVVKDLGLTSKDLITFDEKTWKYLLKKEYITKDHFQSIKLRLQDKKAWAIRVLKENPERVKELWASSPEKMEKVVKTYPSLKRYLIQQKNL